MTIPCVIANWCQERVPSLPRAMPLEFCLETECTRTKHLGSDKTSYKYARQDRAL
jgi:hypothetical protein